MPFPSPPFPLRIFLWACCRTVYQYHILVIIATHSSPLANCALVFTLANVFRGVPADAAAVSLPYICSPYCLLVPLASISPPRFSPPSAPSCGISDSWGQRTLLALLLVFILATAYPTITPDIPSASPFPRPGVRFCSSSRSAANTCTYLATPVALYPSLRLPLASRFVFAIPRRPAAATPHPPFRRSLHHLSICRIYCRHRNVNCVLPRSSSVRSRLVPASLVGSPPQDSHRIFLATRRSRYRSHLYNPCIVIAIVARICTITQRRRIPLYQQHPRRHPAPLLSSQRSCCTRQKVQRLYHHRRPSRSSSSLCAHPSLYSRHTCFSHAQHVHAMRVFLGASCVGSGAAGGRIAIRTAADVDVDVDMDGCRTRVMLDGDGDRILLASGTLVGCRVWVVDCVCVCCVALRSSWWCFVDHESWTVLMCCAIRIR